MAETVETTITHEDISADLRRIVIAGRLDTPGTEEISPMLHELASADVRAIIVDLVAVPFAASIAIGKLIATAKEVRARGGHMVLLVAGTSAVMTSLKMGLIDQIIPVYQYPHEAHAGALRGY